MEVKRERREEDKKENRCRKNIGKKREGKLGEKVGKQR